MILCRKYILSLICLAGLFPMAVNAQPGSAVTGFWRPMSLSAGLKIGGHYRYQEGVTNGIYNYQKNPQFYGGVLFNSSSYFWHPNFMVLELGGEYNPIKNQDDYLVVPDQSEVTTIKKIDISTTFFQQKPVTIKLFLNLNECYTNRENLSNLKLNSSNYGGTLTYSNRILPGQISYRDSKWREQEVTTGRVFNMHQKNLQADINKSFSTLDRNELRYSHNNYYRQDDSLSPINNISDNIDIINRVDFDKLRNYNFSSHISGINQKGYDAYSRIQANESISLKLPGNFSLRGNYDFYHNQRISQKSTQHNIYGALGYQLYKSLTASIYFEDNSMKHSLYQENIKKIGLDIRYIKKIPTGHFSLSYVSNRQWQQRISGVVVLEVYNEEHSLVDGKMVLLAKSYIYENSVIVKDITGTIIYELNFDYILIERNSLIEIQRVPGGQIANNSVIFVDYSYLPPGSYQFNARYRQFSTDVTILDNLLQVYFRLAKQDYDNIVVKEFLTLNYFTQTIVGGRLEYKFASGGVEYESYKSTIIPYRLLRYFIVLQGTLKEKVSYSINANVRNYRMMDNNTNQKYIDLSGNIMYTLAAQTRLNVEFGYKKQLGEGIDLDLLTGKAEISTVFRQVQAKLGFQVYRRIYLNEKTSFIGGYVEIIRNFNWRRR